MSIKRALTVDTHSGIRYTRHVNLLDCLLFEKKGDASQLRKRTRQITGWIAVAILASALFITQTRPPVAAAAGFLRPGQLAPRFALLSLNNKTVTLASLLGKKPIIINAWASWCPPCQEETPEFVKAQKRYGRAITFIGVNLTSIDSVKEARIFAHKYHIPYPVLLDTKGAFRQAYTVIAEPETFVLTRSGRVVMVYVGALPPAWMPQLIHTALTGKTPRL